MSDHLYPSGSFRIAVTLAIFGGMSKFFLVQAPTFSIRFTEAIITALGCGVAGALGKVLVDILKPKLFKWKWFRRVFGIEA